jgi:hypothetical protein
MSTLLCGKLIMKWNWCIFENQIVNCVDSHPIRAGNNSKKYVFKSFPKVSLKKNIFTILLKFKFV